MSRLDDVLVVTVRKSFWASQEAEEWPRRLYVRILYGHSSNLVNSLLVFARALVTVSLRPPRLVLLGSVERTVPWFICARRLRLLRGAKLIVTNQLHLSRDQLAQVDHVIVYASAQAASLGVKGIFLSLPADGDLEAAHRAADRGSYAFSGGGAGRDFATLMDAVRGTDIPLELVVFAPEQLTDAPGNVEVHGPASQHEFLVRMAGAGVVVVPMVAADSPHGQTTLVQALALGKPVVATRAVGTVDYVESGQEGLLVEAGDVEGLRAALMRLVFDDEVRTACAAKAAARGAELTYARFGKALADLCASLS